MTPGRTIRGRTSSHPPPRLLPRERRPRVLLWIALALGTVANVATR